MITNDVVADTIEEFEADPDEFESPPGAVDMDLSATINLGNFHSIKFNLGINEPYTGRKGDCRDDKVEEIFTYIETKLAEKLVTLGNDITPVIRGINEKLTKKHLDNASPY